MPTAPVKLPSVPPFFSPVPRPEAGSASLRGLYVITDERWLGHIATARAALKGGATIIQLRDKTTAPAQLLPIAHQLRALTAAAGACLLVNDRLDLAQLCGADGVHLGPDDWPVAAVRQVLGPEKIIGISCGTPAEAAQALALGADYVGAGAVFSTATKPDAGPAIGLPVLRSIAQATTLPIAAIGGLDATNLAQVLAAGAKMACVVSAVAAAGDELAMEAATRALVRALSVAL